MFKIICEKCGEKADVMSYRKTSQNTLLVALICPSCGNYEEEIHYLYENNKDKK